MVHEPKTGDGEGRLLSGSFSLKAMRSASKTFRIEIETPEVSMQFSHASGNCCPVRGATKEIVISELPAAARSMR